MATRNGIGINNIPFEQRYCPPDPRRRRREKMTWVDRLVCAVCGGFLGFLLWTFGYFILITAAMKAAARQPVAPAAPAPAAAGAAAGVVANDPFSRLPAFSWGGTVAIGFALFGAIAGAERMLDGFEKGIKVEREVLRAVDRS